jgi:hypothetical protein
MKRILLRGFKLAVCLALMLSLILPAAVMADALPCNFVGTARIDGEPALVGTTISAEIGEVEVASNDDSEGTTEVGQYAIWID